MATMAIQKRTVFFMTDVFGIFWERYGEDFVDFLKKADGAGRYKLFAVDFMGENK